jgi:uncharacterized protein
MLRGSGAYMMTDDFRWYLNPAIWCGFFAWLVAQSMKLIGNYFRTRKIDLRYMISLGGMPSSHSALVSATATSVGLSCGLSSPVFAVALVLAFVVMFDAQSVRRASGLQARLLNQIVEEFFKAHHFSQEKLVELLGHTRLEVLLGMFLGILVAVLIHLWYV